MQFREWLLATKHDNPLVDDVRDQVFLDRQFPDVTSRAELNEYVQDKYPVDTAKEAFNVAWDHYVA